MTWSKLGGGVDGGVNAKSSLVMDCIILFYLIDLPLIDSNICSLESIKAPPVFIFINYFRVVCTCQHYHLIYSEAKF
mgnify:CR=1 FL=1